MRVTVLTWLVASVLAIPAQAENETYPATEYEESSTVLNPNTGVSVTTPGSDLVRDTMPSGLQQEHIFPTPQTDSSDGRYNTLTIQGDDDQ